MNEKINKVSLETDNLHLDYISTSLNIFFIANTVQKQERICHLRLA